MARPEVAALVPGHASLLAQWWAEGAHRDPITRRTLLDMQTYLPGDILTKVDRTSMAVSLEARVPLLDHPLVEFAVSLPGHLKLRDGTGKWIFRKAIETIVPPEVLTRPKRGFAVPLEHWFRGPLRHRLAALEAPGSALERWVDLRHVRRIADEHRRGRRDHSTQLWRLLALETWHRLMSAGQLARESGPLTPARAAVA